jgi:Putative collagen-binding domain of a collagenase
MQGPLRVHPTNPRYFTDGSGKAIFLTGSHTWSNLQDYTYAELTSPPPLDFGAYLAFLKRYNHNFFRLWAWENAFNPDAQQGTITYDPMPYQRPGPGTALDGKPKFDLTLFNSSYFDRMRTRTMAAGEAEIYVSVMLFEGFSIEGKGNIGGDPWQGHPFNPKNNINGIDGGGSTGAHTLADPTVTAYQEAYVRKVIDTVNDLDNVLYEITNEDSATPANTAWQNHMIDFVKSVEATKPRQHPVGMTRQWPGDDDALFESPADWISPGAKLLTADGRKVILNDTDHSYFWTGLKADGLAAQRAWVWKNFTRGSQCLFMDPYLDPSHDPGRNDPAGGGPDPYWDTIRDAMGRTRAYATRMNLAAMAPHEALASTGFCLAEPGKEYLVYLPAGGEVTVDLSPSAEPFQIEWMHPVEGTITYGASTPGGAQRTFTAPFAGDAVLYLSR